MAGRFSNFLAVSGLLASSALGGVRLPKGRNSTQGYRGTATIPAPGKVRKPIVYGLVHGHTRRQSGVIAGCCVAHRPQDRVQVSV